MKISFFIPLILVSCVNPFAPKLDRNENSGFELGNLKSIDGVFENFQYAYTFRDTTIYGPLIDKDFIFTFTDYEKGVDVSWGRAEEMKTTYGLFTNAQRLDLLWNEIISLSSDSTRSPDSTSVVRSFELTVTFNPTDVQGISGRASFGLKKNQQGEWKIIKWHDESNY